MVKDEFVTKKLEYLGEVMASSNVDVTDPKSEGSDNYAKALNSAIETCRRTEQDELEKIKVQNQFEIEKMKLENQIKIEEIRAETEKNKEKPVTKMQQALEWAKVLIPTVVPIVAYGVYQRKMLEFEETGTIHTKVGREMHLPNFMK